MLGSNWRKDLEFGLIVAACALILALPIGGLLLAEYAKVHGTFAAYQQNAERDRKATSEEISKTCFKSDFIAFSTCINEKVAAYYKQQATNQDLKAQQDMAYWAKALLFVGLIQLGFSGAGIILVLRSLDLTRIATNAAVESNRDNREIGEAQIRSYVTIESCKFDFINTTPGNIGVLDIGYSNTGQSPAFNFMVEIGLRMIRTENPNFLATGIAPEQHHCQIPSRVVTTVSREFKGSFPIGVPKSSFPSE